MCGLTLSIHRISGNDEDEVINNNSFGRTRILESLIEANASRGPDTQSTFTKTFEAKGGTIEVSLSASVLGLRGGVTGQPLIGSRGVLGWNGQIFDGLELQRNDNDTFALFQELEKGNDPLKFLAGVEGPYVNLMGIAEIRYAFIYLDLAKEKVFFQLDPLSRRSLLTSSPTVTPETLESDTAPESLKVPQGSNYNGFLLSSVRSALTRESGIGMRNLLGGEGGVIDLSKIKVTPKELDLTQALMSWSSNPLTNAEVEDRFTHLTSINRTIPQSDPEIPSSIEVAAFVKNLTQAIRYRVDNIPSQPPGCPRVAVLFSGGVDCTLLAALLHRCLPSDEPVDLINVAFSPPKASNGKKRDFHSPISQNWETPDRISGKEAWKELCKACPREWRFVEVNITYEEAQEHRQKVLDLMYPSCTEMDLSLAYPLYFASRGQGHVKKSCSESLSGEAKIELSGATTEDEMCEYSVKAKVYLSGLGADEQLAGYSRHKHAFREGSWRGLINEIQMDIDRLPTRNLSRDDRIISSHARDARYPYLDLSFVSYLSRLNIWTKCNPSMAEGGDKLLLRLAAKSAGLETTSKRIKRAMQFGTRSSKMSGGSKGPRAGQQKIEE